MAKEGGGIFHQPQGGPPNATDRGTSAKVLNPAGSGSRPTRSSVAIPTSAPSNMHTLDRNPPSPLK